MTQSCLYSLQYLHKRNGSRYGHDDDDRRQAAVHVRVEVHGGIKRDIADYVGHVVFVLNRQIL